MSRPVFSPLRAIRLSLALAGGLAIMVLLSMCIGATGRGLFPAIKALLTSGLTPAEETILFSIRLPRILLACIIGGALSLAGAVFQAILRNPLAEPYVLGVSGGAAVGAIIGIMIGAGAVPYGISGLAFLGGVLTIFLVLGIAERRRELQPNTLLLAGIIVNAFFSAIIMFLVSMSDSAELHNIMFWLIGDLGMGEAGQTALSGAVLLAGFALIQFHARDMNLMVAGEETAMQLGVDVARVRISLLLTASLLTGLAVSLSGIVAFVGLIIPHMVRLLSGSDHRLLLPASLFSGAAFLLLCDTGARTLIAPNELPVGVVTALLGAPFFIYILRRKRT